MTHLFTSVQATRQSLATQIHTDMLSILQLQCRFESSEQVHMYRYLPHSRADYTYACHKAASSYISSHTGKEHLWDNAMNSSSITD